MDLPMLEKMLKMMESSGDTDALMGLRGAQRMFEAKGVGFTQAVLYAAQNVDTLKASQKTTIEQAPASKFAASTAVVNVSGMPDCRVQKPGHVEIVLAGKAAGDPIVLPGASAADAEAIAMGLKDALAAAVVNKSRFKLKLVDVKNKRGEVVETVLQAEYERQGMIAIRIWGNVKGEVAALAAVLRKAVANALPELVAA